MQGPTENPANNQAQPSLGCWERAGNGKKKGKLFSIEFFTV